MRDVEDSLLSKRHLRHALVPTLDDLSYANGALEWRTSVTARVEFVAILEGASVVHGHLVSLLWIVLAVSLLDGLLLDTHIASCGSEGASLPMRVQCRGVCSR